MKVVERDFSLRIIYHLLRGQRTYAIQQAAHHGIIGLLKEPPPDREIQIGLLAAREDLGHITALCLLCVKAGLLPLQVSAQNAGHW
jgi:hypothetical protein